MKWILFIIAFNINGQGVLIQHPTPTTMDECFAKREQVVESLGRPIVGYQAVCVATTEKSA